MRIGWSRRLCNSAAVERDLSLGDLMRQRNRFDGAVYYYDRARKGSPDAPFVLNKLSRALLAAQRPHEAVSHLLHALEVYPDYSTSHTTLGDAYRVLGEPEKARLHYEHAIQINPVRSAAAPVFGGTVPASR